MPSRRDFLVQRFRTTRTAARFWFSPDGRSIGYAASVDLVWHILLDGKLRERPDEIGPEGTPIGFAPDGSFSYLVKRKGAYYRVVEQRQ